MNPSPADIELARKLYAIAGELRTLQQGLLKQRPGCACDERGTCAHHAETHNRLLECMNLLQREYLRLQEDPR